MGSRNAALRAGQKFKEDPCQSREHTCHEDRSRADLCRTLREVRNQRLSLAAWRWVGTVRFRICPEVADLFLRYLVRPE